MGRLGWRYDLFPGRVQHHDLSAVSVGGELLIRRAAWQCELIHRRDAAPLGRVVVFAGAGRDDKGT